MSVPIPPITLFSEPLPNILTQPPETFTLRANATVNEWNFILQQMNDRFVLFNNAVASFSNLTIASNVSWAPFTKAANSNLWTQTFNVPNMVAAIDATARALTNINATMAANTIAGRAGTAGRVQALTLGAGFTFSGTSILVDAAGMATLVDAVARPVTNLNVTAAANTLVGRAGTAGRVQALTLGNGLSITGTSVTVNMSQVSAGAVTPAAVNAAIEFDTLVPTTIVTYMTGNNPSTGAVVANTPMRFVPAVNWLTFQGSILNSVPVINVNVNQANLTAYTDGYARPLTNINATMAANTIAGRAGNTGRVQALTLGNWFQITGTTININPLMAVPQLDAQVRPITGTGYTLPEARLAGRFAGGTGPIQAVGLTDALDFTAEGNLDIVPEFVRQRVDTESRPATNVNLQMPAQSLMGRWSEEDGRWQTISIGAGLKFVGTQLQADNAATTIPALTFIGNPGNNAGPSTPVPISTMVPILDSVPRDVLNSGLRTDPGLLGRIEGYGPIERFALGPGLEMTADGLGRTLDVKGVQQVFAASGSAVRVNALNPKAPTVGLSANAEAILAKEFTEWNGVIETTPTSTIPATLRVWKHGNSAMFDWGQVRFPDTLEPGSIVTVDWPAGFRPGAVRLFHGTLASNDEGKNPLTLVLTAANAQIRVAAENPAYAGFFSGVFYSA